jgi:hypothetical protein
MRGDAPILELRERVEVIPEEWSDVRTPLLDAFEALAFHDVPPETNVSAEQIRAAWIRTLVALMEAADAYERRGLQDLTIGMYTAVLGCLPPRDERPAVKPAVSLDTVIMRAQTSLERLHA